MTSNNQSVTVTSDNLFDYFDEEGYSKTDDDLTFEGEFAHPVDKLYISSKKVNGQNAVFRNMGINLGDDVTVDGLTLISNQYVDNEAALIYASGSGIVLQNIVLKYSCDESQDTYGIYLKDCNDFKLMDSKITFEAGSYGEFYEHGIKIIDSDQLLIQGNMINVSLPILNIQHQNEGLDKDYTLGIGISNSENILIKNNEIHADVNEYAGDYPTLDAIMLIDCSNVTISSNSITETDFFTPSGSSNYLYVLDVYTTSDVLIEKNNISVVTDGGNADAGTSYPIQLSGPYSNVVVDGNNLYANCGGPVLGVYSQSYGGSTEILVKNNFINVTGLPTFNSWGLVSGIEVQDYFAKIYNNTIYTQAVDGTYEDGMNLYGISYAQNLPQSLNNYDIRDNTIFTEGKYGVYLLKAMNSNVTNNDVYSSFAEGNDAVCIVQGENNYVEDNNLIIDAENIVDSSNFFNFFDGEGYLLDNVSFDKLIFRGEFNGIVEYVRISRSISLEGDNAVLNNMGFYVDADDFKLDSLKLVSTDSFEEGLIYICGNNVQITNMDIDYTVNDENAIVINAMDANCINISSNTIHFESHVENDEKSAMAINLVMCENVVMDNNAIDCYLPAISANQHDEDYYMMGLITVSPIKIKKVENLKFTNNILESNTNEIKDTFPTIQGIFVIGSKDVLFDANKFRITDEMSPLGQDCYLYGINFGYNANITVSNNDFKMFTPGGKDSAGTAYALQGMKSDIRIIGNNITSCSNGPNIGIYVTSMTGEAADEYIADNFINVTGLATSTRSWALVTGIEIQNGNAKIYNNTIYTYTVGEYDEDAFCYGVSYAQWMYGNRTLDIQDNTIVTEGKYTISTIATKDAETTPVIIKNNRLTAHNLTGDDSIQLKGINSTVPDDNQTEYNTSGDIAINAANVWNNLDNDVTVTIPNATGTVTITINGKSYTVELIEGVASKTLPAGDLIIGENVLNVTYNNLKNFTAFKVLEGIVTKDNVFDYFNQSDNGRLFDYVPEGVTLDFQGQIKASEIGNFNVYINKAINIISSTEDAFIDINTVAGDYDGSSPGNRFTIDKSGSTSNVSGITFHNTQVWLTNTDHVTLDNISVIVEGQRIGSGVGVTAIRDNSSYITVKNSYFYTRDNGGSSTLVLSWANYCTIDNNTIWGVGNVGNLFYLNTYNIVVPGNVPVNSYNNITNNRIYGPSSSSPICRAICYMGKANLFENNYISYMGDGVVSSDNSQGNLECVFKNNTLDGGASMILSSGGVAYNNTISGKLTLKENSLAYENSIGSLIIFSDNVRAYGNNITGGVTINAVFGSQIKDSKITGDITFERNSENVSLINNDILGTITIKGSKNILKGNNISSAGSYAVVITDSKAIGNIITFNRIYSSDEVGDAAVQDKYNKNNISDNIPISAALSVEDVEDVKVGQSAIVKIHVNLNATGDVKLIFKGVESTVVINNGDGTAVLGDLSEGTYSVEVRFMGDSKYGAKNVTKTFSVSKYDVSLDSLIVSVPDNGNPSFSIELANDAGGNLTVNVNDDNYSENISSGKATVTIPNLAPGKYSAIVSYSGDNKYKSASRNVNFTVKGDCGLDANVNNIFVGDDAVIEVSINADITSGVVVTLNGEYDVNIVNGMGNVTIHNLGVGNYTVNVKFKGNDVFLASELNRTFKVSKIDVLPDELIMDCDGINVEFSLSLTDATGNLTVKINGDTFTGEFVNGRAVVKPDLIPGEYNATVSYAGDEKYNPISKEFKFILKMDPNVDVSVENITVGENATVFVSVNPEITSGVTVVLNGNHTVDIVNGKGNVTVSNLAAGNYTVKAKFEGNDKYSEYEIEKTFSVLKIRLSEDAISVDGNKFSIDVPSQASGNFTVRADRDYTEMISNGKASIELINLAPGEYDVLIAYSGDDTYDSLSKTSKLIVPRYDCPISANVDDIYVNQIALFNVAVLNEATGNVSVIINGVYYNGTLDGGKAIIDVAGLANGTYDAVVKYFGDKNYVGNETTVKLNVLSLIVPDADKVFDIPSDTKSSKYSINMTDAGGNLTVFVNGEAYATKPLVNGSASIEVDGLAAGNYDISVVYSGDEKHASISKNTTLSVPAPHVPVVKLTGSDVVMLYTAGSKYSVKLTSDGSPLSGKTVNFVVNGKKMTATTDKDGVASIKIDLPPKSGEYKVTGEYNGVGASNTVKVKSIMSAKNLKVKKSAKTLKIKVTLKKVNGKYLKSKKVTLKFNGKTYKAKTNKKGVATFKITKKVIKKLKKGKKYTYKATFLKDAVSKKVTVK